LENLDAVNIPEVLEENHAGQPFYRDLDPRDFAALLGDLRVDPIVNKVVAHVPSESLLRRWIHESLEQHALRNFVLVGGNSSRVRYPGPSVEHEVSERDRKSTRLNSSHEWISYAVFCLKKKNKNKNQ